MAEINNETVQTMWSWRKIFIYLLLFVSVKLHMLSGIILSCLDSLRILGVIKIFLCSWKTIALKLTVCTFSCCKKLTKRKHLSFFISQGYFLLPVKTVLCKIESSNNKANVRWYVNLVTFWWFRFSVLLLWRFPLSR